MYLSEVDLIYNKRTREYFDEVLKSYACKSYRSALVSLYSVTICDIIYKLEELSDEYNDKTAEKILIEMKNSIENNKDLSKWESDLIKMCSERNRILDVETMAHLDCLKKYRNLSAHPSLNDNYELYQPDKDITIGLIKNILNKIFIKSPILNKKVIDKLTDDLCEEKQWLLDNRKTLKSFLVKKYYSKMDEVTTKDIFKSLWRFCFVSNNETCAENTDINIAALEILLEYKYDELIEYIKEENILKDVGSSDSQKLSMCKFLFLFPELYKLLDEHLKENIDYYTDNENKGYIFSSFKWDSKENFIEKADISKILLPDTKGIENLYNKYEEEGLELKLLDLFINIFAGSDSFDNANDNYDSIIGPFLKKFNLDQFKKIIGSINSNNQIHSRRRSSFDNTNIVKEIENRYKNNIDYSDYTNFAYINDIYELPF